MQMVDGVRIRRALLSVSDPTGLAKLAQFLADKGVVLLATGGTGDRLRGAGIPVRELSQIAGFRSLVGGRVKSLHPAVHAAILADRGDARHMRELAGLGVEPIDLVVGGLYSFGRVAADGWSRQAAEAVDIGGPAMLRAAAKNHEWVTVVADPKDYQSLMLEIEAGDGGVSGEYRRHAAASVFARISAYDAAVAEVLSEDLHPPRKALVLEQVRALRYGENPRQRAGFYSVAPFSGLASAEQLTGPDLGYNNIADADAAQALVAEFDPAAAAACAIVKHGAPCGAACAPTPVEAFLRARETDPVSAFGGVIGFNCELDAAAAGRITAEFYELVIATGAVPEAVSILGRRDRVRLLTAQLPQPGQAVTEVRTVHGGFLIQERDPGDIGAPDWKIVSKRQPGQAERGDLEFAWKLVRHARSNAVVVVADGAAVGIGSGRTSRVDAAEAAARPLAGREAVAASDGFFPFADGVEVLAAAGVRAIIQPGGSKRDAEVIRRADELGLAMIMTGSRHFRH